MAQNTPENQAQSSFKLISNNKAKTIILETGGYTCEPNELKDAWLRGTISNECYRLVSTILRHSEEFQLKDSYLMPRFGNDRRMLSRAKSEAIERKMIRIEKVKLGRYYILTYNLLDPSEWIYTPLSTIENPTIENSTIENSTIENSTMGITTMGITTVVNTTMVNTTVVNPTPLRRTTPKKKKNKKKNDDEEYEGASSLNGMDKWMAKLRPGEVVNLFKNNGLLPQEKNGHVNRIEDYNKAFRIVFANHTDDQIYEIANRVANARLRLPRYPEAILEHLEALKPSEPKYESIEIYQNAIDEEQWPPGGKSLDDIPF